MKKLLSLLTLSFILLLSVVGCTRGANLNNSPTTSNGNNSASQINESGSTPMVTESSKITPNSTEAKITRDEAKSIALKHAGLTEAEIYDYDIELDFENGILVYEIDFEKDNTDYDYHINATDGTILKSKNNPDY